MPQEDYEQVSILICQSLLELLSKAVQNNPEERFSSGKSVPAHQLLAVLNYRE